MAQNLKPFLKDFVRSQVTMKDLQDRKDNVKKVEEVVDWFIARMKDTDPLFKELFQNIYYAGSFYEGLKVSKADEFDLNVILNLPFRQEEVQVVHETAPKGFVMYKLKQGNLENSLARHPKWSILKNLDKLMDTSHQYLSQNKLNTWFQSIVDKTIQANPMHFQNPSSRFQNVTRSCNGPAKTLTIISSNNDRLLNVDLVPVVKLAEFPGSVTMPRQLRTRLSREVSQCGESHCFIVPKPPPDHIVGQYGRNTADQLFRVSIPEPERLLMDNIGCIKMLVKILKAIRDLENLPFLASYYIKTVFMWQLVNHPEAEFWMEGRLDELFLMMLREIVRVMTVKSLDHIFFQGFNLLAGIQQDSLDHARRQLEYVLQQALSNVPNLYKRYNVQQISV